MTSTEITQETATKETIIITDSASQKIAELISQEEDQNLFLRIGVRPGGCSGLSYEMFFDSEKAENDIFTAKGDVQVAMDSQSAPYLAGATLDYKDGLQGAGFAINNPNVSKSCGCGNSFS